MNKAELVAAVAEKTGLTHTAAAKAVDAFTASVSESLSKGDKVSLVGFGTFSVKERAAREARNPRTGEKIKVAAAKVPAFSAGKGLKDLVK